MNESKFCREVKESLLALYPGSKLFKVHGGLYQTPGLGDLIGCIEGRYVEIETKIINKLKKNIDLPIWGKDLFTENQQYSIHKTVTAGGVAMGIIYIEPLKIAYCMCKEILCYIDEFPSQYDISKLIKWNSSLIITRSKHSEIKWEISRDKIF